jgi:hypothetical protein
LNLFSVTKQEQLDRRRYYSVLWFLVGFTVWWGGRTLQELWPSLGVSALTVIVTGVSLIGWGVWGYHLVRIVRLCHGLSEREWRRLNDERVQQNQRAAAVGFWALLGTAGLVLLGSAYITTAAAGHLLLLVGIVASGGGFLYFESGGGRLASNGGAPEVAHE